MEKEDILQWLISFGREWTDIEQLYEVYAADPVDPHDRKFWKMLDDMHDAMYITKRNKVEMAVLEFMPEAEPTEILNTQYRLTERAINSLEE
jgi:hypothetical protein